jgi:hypothetical protein
MMMAKGVPHHHIGIFDRAIGFSPLRQSFPTRILVGVVTCGIALVGMVGCHPQMFVHKTCPFQDRRVWMGKRKGIVAGNQFKPDQLSQPIKSGRVCNFSVLCSPFTACEAQSVMPPRLSAEAVPENYLSVLIVTGKAI